jgi:transposase
MAGKSRRSKLVLSEEVKAELEQVARSRTVTHREAQRSAILLGYYAGESITKISRRLGMTRLSVTKWVAKALAVGPMAALKDNYHRPKEPVIGDDAKAWVVHVACSKPKELGYAAEVWSRQALARHIREHAVEAGFPALSRAAKATKEFWRHNRCIRRKSSTTWSGAIRISRSRCGESCWCTRTWN